MVRPKKNMDVFVGREGRIAFDLEKRTRETRRWQRRKETIQRFVKMK